MAKKSTGKSDAKSGKSEKKSGGTQVARVSSSSSGGGSGGQQDGFNAGEAFTKLLQSPLVAELVAVAATAALAALAQHGFTTADGDARRKRAGKAVKEAGKAAMAAVGQRLGTEFDEIRKAAKGGAEASA